MNKLQGIKHKLKTSIWVLNLFVCLLVLLVSGAELFSQTVGAQSPDTPRRINVPYFSENLNWGQTAIVWLGQNEQGAAPTRNYSDVRIGYTDSALEIRVTVADYYLWYDPTANSSTDLTQYDTVTIYLDTNNDRATAPQTDDYRFRIGARHWENINNYMRQARGNGGSWNTGWTPPSNWMAQSGLSWSCNPGPNSNACGIDYGWTAIFTIPWTTLGLSGRPSDGIVWGLGVQVHDQDLNSGTPLTPEVWPESLSSGNPSLWGELAFNPPAPQPSGIVKGTTIIRRATETDTSVVQDAWMGGGGWCSGGHNGGADTNHGGFNPDSSIKERELFIGSEVTITHLPCFNKSFMRFNLDDVPPDKTIISATLTMHHWGNSGNPGASSDEDRPHNSYVWLYNIVDPWSETGITWNNAPPAQKNLDMIEITPLNSFPGWPGVPYTWNATEAVVTAYAAGQPVDLAIYDSASDRNTSKYFVSSETGDWNFAGRPTLTIIWGSSVGTVQKIASPSNVDFGKAVTYTLTIVGSGQTITMIDELPIGLSAPLAQSAELNYVPHRLTWTGTPTEGEKITLTYTVSATVSSHVALWNQAFITQTDGLTDTATALVLANPTRTYLPLILKRVVSDTDKSASTNSSTAD